MAALFRKERNTTEEKQKALYISTGIIAGIILFFLLFKSSLFNFEGPGDKEINPVFLEILKEDRSAIFTQDAIRSLLLILATAGVLWALIHKKIKENIVIVIIGGLLLFDLVGVAQRYVYDDGDRYVTKAEFDNPFETYDVDRNILKEVDLFDVYEGKNLEKGKKSYAVNFIFQDAEKTLQDKVVDKVMAKIRQGLENELGAELR